MVSYRNILHSGVTSPALLFSVNQEWWLKQRGTKLKAEKELFSFPFLWSGEAVSHSFLHLTVGWELLALPACSAHSHPFLLTKTPAPSLPVQPTISALAGSGGCPHREARGPCSEEGENHWRWILTCVGWAATAEDDRCIEPTLGCSGKLIHFLFTL